MADPSPWPPTPLPTRALRGAFILALHLPPLSLLWTGVDRRHLVAFLVFYPLAVFAIGGALHRYFAHRPFRTSRAFQLFLGLLVAAFFGDPVAFAGRHRLHHRHADTERDFHGPGRGLWFGWIGHLLEDGYPERQVLAVTRDLTVFPELRFLHRFSYVPGLLAFFGTWAVFGWPALAAGYCLAWCLAAIHGASAVNYLCHLGGPRRYATPDRSANRPLLALLLFGEGWHNNHHHYPSAARSGFLWYEVDVLYYAFRALAAVGLIWDLREVPDSVKRARLTEGEGSTWAPA